mgnify:CR=1 FL=1
MFEKKITPPQLNILGDTLQTCSLNPLTGYFRDGCCNTEIADFGSHTVCAEMTEEFLFFSKQSGNDLTTPHPEFGFDGLKPGDRWCLCASRWLEAANVGKAPSIIASCTNEAAINIVPKELLLKYAIKLN